MATFRVLLFVLVLASLVATVAAYPTIRGNLVLGTETGTTTVTSNSSSTSSTTSTTSSATSTTTQPVGTNGTLYATIDIGPIQPVCRANSTTGPAPAYSSNELRITRPSGTSFTVPLTWLSNGCDAFSSTRLSLLQGSYVLNLTNCTYMGCSSALPRAFTITKGQTTTVQVYIDTGIR